LGLGTSQPTTFTTLNLSEGTEKVVDHTGGGVLGPKGGIAMGILLILGFGCASGPKKEWTGCVASWI
jgi:hypothetical protein